MAAAQREAGRLSIAGLDADLEMDKLPTAGLLTTDSRDPAAFVTDSAAAATAWSTGQKTYNGAISVDVNKNPLQVLGEQAKAAGKATGLVTTAQVTDASPAAFFARTADRRSQDEIARQYLDESKPDVILGGGEDWWHPAGTPGTFPDNPAEDPEEASKGTKGDLVERARTLGYTYAGDAQQLQQANGPKLLGLFANEEMFQQKPEGQGDVYAPVVDLPTMTRKALDTLDGNQQGFYLFVEEEAVDEFAHNNNGPRVLQAMAQLDAAVIVARQYVARYPDTLLVVTGDHECGGLTIEGVDAKDETGTGDSRRGRPLSDQRQRQAVRHGLDDRGAHRRPRPRHRRRTRSRGPHRPAPQHLRARCGDPRPRPLTSPPSRSRRRSFTPVMVEAAAPGSLPAPRPRRPPGSARRSSPSTSRVVRSRPAGRSRPTPGR